MNMEANEIIVNYDGKPLYKIISSNDFLRLSQLIVDLKMEDRRFFIVTDDNVSKYYLEPVIESIQQVSKTIEYIILPAGEKNKNLDTVNQCYEKLIENNFDRNDVLIALGGGVVGDLTGFVAATYLRGVRFIQIPTSLLAMVDSSIGGKTGVDYNSYKNMVGSFHQPSLVYMNLETLTTLPDREYYSAMAEIIKHGLISDYKYFIWLISRSIEILSKNYDVVKEMIARSCIIKKEIVERDPKEAGERALLNFGHTIGHSIEKLKEFTVLHGECVAIGMVASAYISYSRDYIDKKEYDRILKTLQVYHLPTKIDNLTAEEIYQVTKLDKKMDSNNIKFILLKKPGQAFIDTSISKEELIESIQSVIKR